MISLDTVPIQAKDIVYQIVDNEAVLVLPGQGQVKVLNEVGGRIWALTDAARSVGEIAAQIADEYDVSLDQAQTDTLDFLTQLAARDMVFETP